MILWGWQDVKIQFLTDQPKYNVHYMKTKKKKKKTPLIKDYLSQI